MGRTRHNALEQLRQQQIARTAKNHKRGANLGCAAQLRANADKLRADKGPSDYKRQTCEQEFGNLGGRRMIIFYARLMHVQAIPDQAPTAIETSAGYLTRHWLAPMVRADAPPRKDDGSLDWSQVTSIRIIFIGDYHD